MVQHMQTSQFSDWGGKKQLSKAAYLFYRSVSAKKIQQAVHHFNVPRERAAVFEVRTMFPGSWIWGKLWGMSKQARHPVTAHTLSHWSNKPVRRI